VKIGVESTKAYYTIEDKREKIIFNEGRIGYKTA